MDASPEKQKQTDACDTRVRMLATLNACGYFNDETAISALQAMSNTPEIDMQIGSTREMLDWLIQQGFVEAQLAEVIPDQFVRRLESNEAPDGLIPYASMIEEIDPRFKVPFAAFAERRRKKMKRVMIGYALSIPIIIAAGAAYTLWPASTPSCTASDTTKALNWIAIKSTIELTTKSPALLLKDTPESPPRFEEYKEVGYDDGDKSRGCAAVVKEGTEATPIGYVIRPKEKKDEFEVHTYPYEYVAARYSAPGLNKALGAPLGRDAIRTALMKGISGIDTRVGSMSPGYYKPIYGQDEPATMEASVMGVLPAADCRRIDDRSYACPVLIDYKDRLLNAVGIMPYVQLKGEFVLQRDGDGWTVTKDFDEKFLSTLVNGRVKNTYGPEVAAKMEQSTQNKTSSP